MAVLPRSTYHHRELRHALITAADTIIRENGIEGFSLREAARQAGVSPGAPAHHFGSIAGLLTEVAILAYEELGTNLASVVLTGDHARDLRALATVYVEFALYHPGRFRLMFRKDLVDRADPRYREISFRALFCFGEAAAAYYGVKFPAEGAIPFHPALLAAFASIHGIAHLAIEDKWSFALRGNDHRADFLSRLLPGILGVQWPVRC